MPHHPWYSHSACLTAVDVALATSAAPTSFPAHTIPGRGTFIDGGLWANCPAMVEALDFLGQAPEHIQMLSLSTTSYPFRPDDPAQLHGLVGWAPKIIDTPMSGQAHVANERLGERAVRSFYSRRRTAGWRNTGGRRFRSLFIAGPWPSAP